jgi:homoserine dehydrogenase
MAEKVIQFGIIGLGYIGTGVAKNFLNHQNLIRSRSGVGIVLKKVADVNLCNREKVPLGNECFVEDAKQIIDDPEIPIVVELIGGTGVAKDFIIKALLNGKKVVTANKALIAEYGKEIMAAMEKSKSGELFFEGSVGGGIPVIKVLREGFIGNEIKDITAIINGTSNYILSDMEKNGVPFERALKSAQKKGFAEADPTFDVEGTDSAHKIAILGALAFGTWIDYKKIYVEGIAGITNQDILYARRLGYKIKLLAIARKGGEGLEVRVNPALLDLHHPLSAVDGAYNAVHIKGFPVGSSMLYGMGAGEDPTSSAIISDIVDAAQSISFSSGRKQVYSLSDHDIVLADKMSWQSRYYLRIQADDKPGVLAKVAGILGENNISLSTVLQLDESTGRTVPVIMLTHMAVEKDVVNACSSMEKIDCIKGKVMIIRVLTENDK